MGLHSRGLIMRRIFVSEFWWGVGGGLCLGFKEWGLLPEFCGTKISHYQDSLFLNFTETWLQTKQDQIHMT